MEYIKEKGEIVLYQPNDTIKVEVWLEQDTIWLTQQQIADLFRVKQPAISKHLSNIFKEGELDKDSVHSILEYTASDGKTYKTQFYNLDAILSVGYRVNSVNATAFRRWATSVLRQHLLRGYSINKELTQLEDRIERKLATQHDEIRNIKEIQEKQQSKIDFFVRTSLPPVEGLFFECQMWDAHILVTQLVQSAKKRIVLIDNYINDTVLTLLDKRIPEVTAEIYTMKITRQLELDIAKHNSQYSPIPVKVLLKAHDRFLIIDNDVYHIGASIKDLGKKWSAIIKMENTDSSIILSRLQIPDVGSQKPVTSR